MVAGKEAEVREYLKRASPQPAVDRRAVEETVRGILEHVRREGDAAVREYSRRYDRWDPPRFRVMPDEVERARQALPPALIDDIAFTAHQVREFARCQLDTLRPLEVEMRPGVVLGHRHIPVASVGCYVPGGRYPLIASALMSIATPKVAGVERVVACAPPRGEGIYPATLVAMAVAGADEIYCLGGVQALAAMAYGTAEISPVDMIVGPGNQYVVEAKRQLFGVVGVDLLAGPTEILVIADHTADPHVVAADLLGQAEHDPASPAVLVTTSRELGTRVLAEIAQLLPTLPTAEVIGISWRDRGEVVVVDSDDEAAAVADEYAPEHLEVQTRNPDWYLQRLRNYGTLFLGEESTVVYSDKAVGTNHILPTGRAARFTGGLWVGKFLKTVTYQRLTREGSLEIARRAAAIAAAEGMEAHVYTARLRLRRYHGHVPA
ncbi:MAG: histidinol dehydrogenase [Armatimonadota bacterium]|nr:histidinol dehydrogenase [Armatimonadota bacterium]MDR7485739.1 histidinol dehydrogenase [Armatimonadota bacterium]